jgi:hypothetical protein
MPPGALFRSVEMHSDAIVSAPYHAAWKPQTVIRYDQCKFIGNAEKIGKLQRCTGAGYVANNACVLVATIVDFGSFHNSDAWRNPSFNHHNNPDPNAADGSMVTLMAPKRAAQGRGLECDDRIDRGEALTPRHDFPRQGPAGKDRAEQASVDGGFRHDSASRVVIACLKEPERGEAPKNGNDQPSARKSASWCRGLYTCFQ